MRNAYTVVSPRGQFILTYNQRSKLPLYMCIAFLKTQLNVFVNVCVILWLKDCVYVYISHFLVVMPWIFLALTWGASRVKSQAGYNKNTYDWKLSLDSIIGNKCEYGFHLILINKHVYKLLKNYNRIPEKHNDEKEIQKKT